MLIDPIEEDFFHKLDAQVAKLVAPHTLYLLIDGAFVPGLHQMIAADRKSLLFSLLPGCNNETADASPFLAPVARGDKRIRSLLRRCDRWPMVSLIETPELLSQLSARLSAWCVIEADGQRFNFRFADTRRLPAIFRTLNGVQRAQFAGPAASWSYVERDGRWGQLEVPVVSAEPAVNPVLDALQFGTLVDDSRADEILVLLARPGTEKSSLPSATHARVVAAIRAADPAELPDDDLLHWCECFLHRGKGHDDFAAKAAFETWQKTARMEKQE